MQLGRIGGRKCLFYKDVRVAAALVAPFGMAAFAAIWLGLQPGAERYFGIRAAAATVESKLGDRPVASSAAIEQFGDRARLIFELSAPLNAAAFVLADPERVVVDLPQTDFALDPETGKPGHSQLRRTSLITAFRFGQLEPGKSRIVIDLGGPARIIRAACEKSETDGRTRLIIELAKTDLASFQSAVRAARAQLAAVAPPKKEQKPEAAASRPVIMLDPGHGGIDKGAMVKGLIEKDLVFEFAKAVAAKLEADGRFAVVMTRYDDSFVSLAERVRLARDGHAALFVSIHADTLSEEADVSGATVYTLSDRASDAEAARVAEKENQADLAAGLDAIGDSSEVSDILFDLARRETRVYSHWFAHTLTNYWQVAGRLNKNPRRSARFRVLKAPDVPSVLLELGYLSNEKDGQALNSPPWREKAASQVAKAIEAYFSVREGNETVTKVDPDPAPVAKLRQAEP
jgi:N-acetylmuramoyl-L-alanine amidase